MRDNHLALFSRFLIFLTIFKINKKNNKQPESPSANYMGILDIFGFEIFDNNRFEQLCINYCNERLQNFFNVNIFEYEQKECQREGVMLDNVTFADNKDCVTLIDERPGGILALLDEEGALPGGSDANLLSKYHEKFSKHPKFKKPDPRKKQKEFCVIHYAGDVSYEIAGFIDRNKAAISPDILDIMENSGNPFLSDLFIQYQAQQMAQSEKRNTNKRKRTKSDPKKPPALEKKRSSFIKSSTTGSIASTFKEQLNDLMDNIALTTPHYVRCICSNYQQLPMNFNSTVVLNQLNCAGILDCVRVRMLGYPIRRSYGGFLIRYKSLFDKGLLDSHLEEKAMVEKFLTVAGADLKGLYQFGTSKVFMKDKVSRLFEDKRTQVLGRVVVPIQRAYRAYIDRIHYKELRSAVVTLEQAMRRAAALKNFNRLKAQTLQRLEKERVARELAAKKEREEREKKEREEKERKEREEKEKKAREEKEKKDRKEKEEKVDREKKEERDKKEAEDRLKAKREKEKEKDGDKEKEKKERVHRLPPLPL